MYKSPIRDHGAIQTMKTFSYQVLLIARMPKRVIIAAPSGMPRKIPTLIETVVYETFTVEVEWLMMRTKKMANGA